MSLPSPNLDDRKFDDLVQEAFQRIQQRCPEWTDFNPSDPGVMLVELMAWMTETTLYRLNRVPEKNYIKFLELLGLSLTPAHPAMAWVHFSIAKGTKEELVGEIPAGTEVVAKGAMGDEIPFVTTHHLPLTTANIRKIISVSGDQWLDHTEEEGELTKGNPPIFFGDKGITLFKNLRPQQHILYLGDAHLGEWTEKGALTVHLEVINPEKTGVQLAWEIYQKGHWVSMVPHRDDTGGMRRNGDIVFDPIPSMDPTVVFDRKAFWVRARLLAQSGRESPSFSKIQGGIQVKEGFGFPAEKGILNAERGPHEPLFREVDLSKEFFPFGRNPQTGDIWYLKSSAFGRTNSKVILEVRLAALYTSSAPKTLEDLEIQWEYYVQTGEWKTLGISTPTGVKGDGAEGTLLDETRAFTQNGKITFHSLPDVTQTEVQREQGFYLRARIIQGDYGKEFPNSPCLASLRIRFSDHPQDWSVILAQNGNEITVLGPEEGHGLHAIQPFETGGEKVPTVHLAFDQLPSNKTHRLYINLKPDQDKGSDALRWEYETANGWEPLQVVQDETRGFRQSGSLEYLAPTDWAPANHFGIKDSSGKKDWRGYWLRIQWLRWDENAFPVVKGIVCNAVGVIQVKVKQNEILGSGTGEAFQMVSLPHHPVQPDPEIVIKEMTKPNPEQIRWFKETIGQEPEKDPQSGKVEELWVPWIPVNNFLFSGRDDRHFILDATKGTVTFGDGKRGRIPPAGSGNIKARSYRLTKGRQGNVGKGEIDTLRISKPGVDSVRNPEPVTGGVDIETIEEAKHRGPWMLKHRDRAVTIEDYEELAGRASREVGIAKASMQGQTMQVLIIPSSDDPKPQPSRTLLGTVQEFLDKRRVLTAALQVVGPMYTEVHFDMKLALKSEAKAQEGTIRQTILTGIQKMLHPLYGGDQGKGWPMGRALHVSEIYYLIEQIAEVDFVTQLWVWTGNLKTRGDRVQIPANGFPALGSLTVEIVKG